MLIKSEMNAAEKPIIIKYVDGVDRSRKAAFPSDKDIVFTVKTPRKLGAAAVVLRVNKDGEALAKPGKSICPLKAS